MTFQATYLNSAHRCKEIWKRKKEERKKGHVRSSIRPSPLSPQNIVIFPSSISRYVSSSEEGGPKPTKTAIITTTIITICKQNAYYLLLPSWFYL